MMVGQKVVCIDGKFDEVIKTFYTALPVEGVTYVIRGMGVGFSPKRECGEVWVTLIGLNNPRSAKAPFPERAFNAMRFRPLDEIQEENSGTKRNDDEIQTEKAQGDLVPSQARE